MRNLNDIFNATVQSGVEVMYNNSHYETRVIKSINEFKDFIEDVKTKVEKEVKTWTCIDLIDWCDDNDIELVPLRKEKVIEIEKIVLEVKIQPKMNK